MGNKIHIPLRWNDIIDTYPYRKEDNYCNDLPIFDRLKNATITIMHPEIFYDKSSDCYYSAVFLFERRHEPEFEFLSNKLEFFRDHVIGKDKTHMARVLRAFYGQLALIDDKIETTFNFQTIINSSGERDYKTKYSPDVLDNQYVDWMDSIKIGDNFYSEFFLNLEG